MIKVTIFNEYFHEQKNEEVKKAYPAGIHGCLKELFEEEGFVVRVLTQHDEEGNLKEDVGITEELLKDTDVLVWWGHLFHRQLSPEVTKLVNKEVNCGMGAIFLHSAHHAEPFISLMGTPCDLKWREGAKERLWVIDPTHPIMKGLPEYIDLPDEEMYGERFTVPTPDELLMIGTYATNEVFRSACVWKKTNGKVFYFQPGHETNPIYYMPEIRSILANAVRYVAPAYRVAKCECEQYFGEAIK